MSPPTGNILSPRSTKKASNSHHAQIEMGPSHDHDDDDEQPSVPRHAQSGGTISIEGTISVDENPLHGSVESDVDVELGEESDHDEVEIVESVLRT